MNSKAWLADTDRNRRSPSRVVLWLVVGALPRVVVHVITILLASIHAVVQSHGRWGYLPLLVDVMHGRITTVDAVGRDERWIGWCHLSSCGIVLS